MNSSVRRRPRPWLGRPCRQVLGRVVHRRFAAAESERTTVATELLANPEPLEGPHDLCTPLLQGRAEGEHVLVTRMELYALALEAPERRLKVLCDAIGSFVTHREGQRGDAGVVGSIILSGPTRPYSALRTHQGRPECSANRRRLRNSSDR